MRSCGILFAAMALVSACAAATPASAQLLSHKGLTSAIAFTIAETAMNLALADAANLADALGSAEGWQAVTAYEAAMMQRAAPAAEGAAEGLNSSISSQGAAAVLDHYRARVSA